MGLVLSDNNFSLVQLQILTLTDRYLLEQNKSGQRTNNSCVEIFQLWPENEKWAYGRVFQVEGTEKQEGNTKCASEKSFR